MQQPPSYTSSIRTVYDETHRGIWHPELLIQSMGNHPNLLGLLEHRETTTDGVFSICFANGRVVFISKASVHVIPSFYKEIDVHPFQSLYESVPEKHRPILDTSESGREVGGLTGPVGETLGSTYFPFLLMADNNEKVRVILKVYVLPRLLMGIFWGAGGPFGRNVHCSAMYNASGVNFRFDFKNGQTCNFKGLM